MLQALDVLVLTGTLHAIHMCDLVIVVIVFIVTFALTILMLCVFLLSITVWWY